MIKTLKLCNASDTYRVKVCINTNLIVIKVKQKINSRLWQEVTTQLFHVDSHIISIEGDYYSELIEFINNKKLEYTLRLN